MDINRDGVITFDEFMETCRRVSRDGLYFKVNKQAWRHPAETNDETNDSSCIRMLKQDNSQSQTA